MIKASEARKITDTNVGKALHEELADIFAKIKALAEDNKYLYSHPKDISAAAKKVLEDAGYSVKAQSHYNETNVDISW